MPFVRPRMTEAGVLGAAMLAGLATGIVATTGQAAEIFVKRERVFEPDANRHAIYREKHALFQQLFPALEPILQQL